MKLRIQALIAAAGHNVSLKCYLLFGKGFFLIYILALLTVNRALVCLTAIHSCIFCLPFNSHLISIALNGKPIIRLVLRVASLNDLQPDTSFLLICTVHNNQRSVHFLPLLPLLNYWKDWLTTNVRKRRSTFCCQQPSCRQAKIKMVHRGSGVLIRGGAQWPFACPTTSFASSQKSRRQKVY